MTEADSVHSTPPINTSAPDLRAPQGALYIRTPVTPEEAFQAIGQLRKEARDEIDRLIRFLDKTDDYVSRELEEAVDDEACDDNELEPTFCGTTADPLRNSGLGDELEADYGNGQEADDEPALGSVAADQGASQAGWAAGGNRDLEDEHDGGEPSLCGITADCRGADDRDLEADLGSFDRMIDQRKSTLVAEPDWRFGHPVIDGEIDGPAVML